MLSEDLDKWFGEDMDIVQIPPQSVQFLPEKCPNPPWVPVQMHPTEWKPVNSPILEQETFAIN